MKKYLFDSEIEFGLICIDNRLEIGLILIVFGVEIKDDFGELCNFFAHFMMKLSGGLVHGIERNIFKNML